MQLDISPERMEALLAEAERRFTADSEQLYRVHEAGRYVTDGPYNRNPLAVAMENDDYCADIRRLRAQIAAQRTAPAKRKRIGSRTLGTLP